MDQLLQVTTVLENSPFSFHHRIYLSLNKQSFEYATVCLYHPELRLLENQNVEDIQAPQGCPDFYFPYYNLITLKYNWLAVPSLLWRFHAHSHETGDTMFTNYHPPE